MFLTLLAGERNWRKCGYNVVDKTWFITGLIFGSCAAVKRSYLDYGPPALILVFQKVSSYIWNIIILALSMKSFFISCTHGLWLLSSPRSRTWHCIVCFRSPSNWKISWDMTYIIQNKGKPGKVIFHFQLLFWPFKKLPHILLLAPCMKSFFISCTLD